MTVVTARFPEYGLHVVCNVSTLRATFAVTPEVPPGMPLHVRSADLADGSNALRTLAGAMSTKMVSGTECSIMVARRDGGYHSKPHYHESEQLNYVMAGELWVFVETDGFLCRAGDFFRIPANAVHWGWNRSEEPVTTFQVHAPALDPGRPEVFCLARDGETLVARGDSRNIPVDDPKYARAEEEVVRRAQQEQPTAPAEQTA